MNALKFNINMIVIFHNREQVPCKYEDRLSKYKDSYNKDNAAVKPPYLYKLVRRICVLPGTPDDYFAI